MWSVVSSRSGTLSTHSKRHRVDGLKYVVFGLGNKTYEHYNAIARIVDRELEEAGATRIGERGEGDDDKSMEEDYLEWKDGMWDAFAKALEVEEGQGSDTADFVVGELESHPEEKVYLGSSPPFAPKVFHYLLTNNFQANSPPVL